MYYQKHYCNVYRAKEDEYKYLGKQVKSTALSNKQRRFKKFAIEGERAQWRLFLFLSTYRVKSWSRGIAHIYQFAYPSW